MVTVAKVAVKNTVYHFDKPFDYLVPDQLLGRNLIGCRVKVPFGTANTERIGMVMACETVEPTAPIKSIAAVLDKAPLLSDEGIALVSWMKQRYFCTYFDAIGLLLPTGINLKLTVRFSFHATPGNCYLCALTAEEKKLVAYLMGRKKAQDKEAILKALALPEQSLILEELAQKGYLKRQNTTVRQIGDATQRMARLKEEGPVCKLTVKQQAVYDLLNESGPASVKEVCYFSGTTPAVVNTLAAKGVLELFEEEIDRNPYVNAESLRQEQKIVLSQEQQAAFDRMYSLYRERAGAVSLLYGVTGSGKTSVFLRLIDQVQAEGDGVIVMVPEISLTPQMVFLFHCRYGKNVAVFHSGLTLAERLDEWKRVRRGEATIAVGTRSAVFAPLDNIGLIIMDEEQEGTYKSESAPRYHARDIAKFRCSYHKALLVLASATPSVESFYNALHNKYQLNRLSTRYGQAKLPDVKIVDMNNEVETGNTTAVSRTLYQALHENLAARRQSIILLNRRGYHTFVSCRSCGYVVTCPNCSISMTYHAANKRLMCHYCGYSAPFQTECPQCHSNKVKYAGAGTQRAEEQIQELFPAARILRLDADTTMSKTDYETKLGAFSRKEYDLMIGTQMVAKGLDFENVTLVGVLSADQELYSDDYRSYERTFSLLTQVVGRSGRGRYKGTAIIQTFTPENAIIHLAAQQNYDHFYENEILLRQTMLYPPFSDICLVGFVGVSASKVEKGAHVFLAALAAAMKGTFSDQPLRVLQPTQASVFKVNQKYRYKLIIKCRNSVRFRSMVDQLLKNFLTDRRNTGVSIFIDMNPDMIM